MEYRIVTHYPHDLPKIIEDYLSKGWELYGNPFPHEGYVCQAMVKKNACLECAHEKASA